MPEPLSTEVQEFVDDTAETPQTEESVSESQADETQESTEEPVQEETRVPYSRFKEVNDKLKEFETTQAPATTPSEQKTKEQEAKGYLKGLLKEVQDEERVATATADRKAKSEIVELSSLHGIDLKDDTIDEILKFKRENHIESNDSAIKLYRDTHKETTKSTVKPKVPTPGASSASDAPSGDFSPTGKTVEQVIEEAKKEHKLS